MAGRRKNSIYTDTFNQELEFKVLDVLVTSRQALMIDQIKQRDLTIKDVTSQKMTRVLSSLIEMGFVRKGKSKATGRMYYKSVAVMQEEGYDIDGT